MVFCHMPPSMDNCQNGDVYGSKLCTSGAYYTSGTEFTDYGSLQDTAPQNYCYGPVPDRMMMQEVVDGRHQHPHQSLPTVSYSLGLQGPSTSNMVVTNPGPVYSQECTYVPMMTQLHQQLSSAPAGPHYPMMHPQHPQQPQQQSMADYTDVNNLEPSLVPCQMDVGVGIGVGHPSAHMACVPSDAQPSMNCYNAGDLASIDYGTNPAAAAAVAANCFAQFHHSSPTESSHTSGTDISEEDDSFSYGLFKRSPPAEANYSRASRNKRQGKKRKPKKDPNEPQKPVSAYAMFFRDTQATIKGQSPNASFGEVSKIVASMWDALDADAKNAYKQKTEAAKKDYLKQLAAYRARLLSNMNSRQTLAESSYDELVEKGRHLPLLSSQKSPDSTTLNPDQKEMNDVGEKSLASLIAEPAPLHILTATTTLTVPQTTATNRVKSDGDVPGEFQPAPTYKMCIRRGCNKLAVDCSNWDGEYCSSECVVKHCREVFNTWVESRQPALEQQLRFAPL